MELVNESSKLVAKALEILKTIYTPDGKTGYPIDETIQLLEEALAKLTTPV